MPAAYLFVSECVVHEHESTFIVGSPLCPYGTVYADPRNCQGFYTCDDGVSTLMYCILDQVFSLPDLTCGPRSTVTCPPPG